MRIATITYSWAQNWGAVLQAYALVEYLNSIGHEARLIDYRPFDNKLISTVKSIPDGIVDLLTIPASKKRIDRFNEFRINALKLTQKCNTTDELKELNNEFEAFITGSDQVWNVGLGVCKDFYLEFAEESKKRISYAASFGVKSIPEEHKKDTIEGINNIQAISVREESGKKIVSDLTGREATVVLDPVFLLDADHWRKVSRKSGQEGKYIFVYPTQVTETLKNTVKQLKKETGLMAISPFYVPGCKTIKDIGPREFIDYIANAEYIVASSFHATAFSILFEKKLFVVAHSQTGSRTIDLLKDLNMQKCIITKDSFIFNVKWDYNEIRERVKARKEISRKFIDKALK